jgi:hypothetical protein
LDSAKTGHQAFAACTSHLLRFRPSPSQWFSLTHGGARGSSKDVAYVYPYGQELHIYSSGDLTHDKMAMLVEMNIDGG